MAGIGPSRAIGQSILFPVSGTPGLLTASGAVPRIALVVGVEFYLPASASVTFGYIPAGTTTAPAQTFTLTGATGGSIQGLNFNPVLTIIYITAISGAPLFRWI